MVSDAEEPTVDLADQLAGNGQRLPRGRLGRTRCRGRVLKRSHLDGFDGVGGGDLGLVVPPHVSGCAMYARCSCICSRPSGARLPGAAPSTASPDHSASGFPTTVCWRCQVCRGSMPCARRSVRVRPRRAQLRRVAPLGGQRSAFEDGAAGPDQAGDAPCRRADAPSAPIAVDLLTICRRRSPATPEEISQ